VCGAWGVQSATHVPRLSGTPALGREALVAVLQELDAKATKALREMSNVAEVEVRNVGSRAQAGPEGVQRVFNHWYDKFSAGEREVLSARRVTESEVSSALAHWLGEGDAEVRALAEGLERKRPVVEPSAAELAALREECGEVLLRMVRDAVRAAKRDSPGATDADILRAVQGRASEMRDEARLEALRARGPGYEFSSRLLWVLEAAVHLNPWHRAPAFQYKLADVYAAEGLDTYAEVLRKRGRETEAEEAAARQSAAKAALQASFARAGGGAGIPPEMLMMLQQSGAM
jgi:hypothetical protein